MTKKNNELASCATLEVFNGPLAGRIFKVGDEAIIGREDKQSGTSGIFLPDSHVSRQHARIFKIHDHYLLEDLNSKNGTFLNARHIEPLKPVILRKGSNVQVGETHMKFSTGSRPEASGTGSQDKMPWQSEIGINEQAFDFSNPYSQARDKKEST